jgi:thiamine-phosphate pyrophosphorylase
LISFQDCRLYTIVDTAYLGGRSMASVTEALCDGGSDVIQLRAKTASPGEIRVLAENLLPITSRSGVALVVNDYPDVARAAGAQACHLGQEDFFDRGHTQAGQVTGSPPVLQLGLSTHTPDQARRALDAGPDYIAIGPVHATPTKPGARPVGLDYVRWAAAHVPIPWFAIGGITLDNLAEVLEAGATRVCVVSAILKARNIAEACRQFKERLISAPRRAAMP